MSRRSTAGDRGGGRAQQTLGRAQPARDADRPLDPNALAASVGSDASQRRGSLDQRSLRSPSVHGASPSSAANPSSRISSSPSVTAALSASPNTFNIGRSPSGGVYDSQGGAAARLKRVASNVSIAGSLLRSKMTTTTEQRDADQSNEGQRPDRSPQSDATDRDGLRPTQPQSEVSAKQDASSAAQTKPAATGSSSRSVQPTSDGKPANTPMQSSESVAASATVRPGDVVNEADAKRPRPPPHTELESTARSSARRRTWYGWTPGTTDGRDASEASPSAPSATAVMTKNDVGLLSNELSKDQRNLTEEQIPPNEVDDAATLRPDRGDARKSVARKSWFGWGQPTEDSRTSAAGVVQQSPQDEVAASACSANHELAAAHSSSHQDTEDVSQGQLVATDSQSAALTASAPQSAQSQWWWRLWPTQSGLSGGDSPAVAAGAEDQLGAATSGDSTAVQATAGSRADTHQSIVPHALNATSSGWLQYLPYWGRPIAADLDASGEQSHGTAQETATSAPLTPAEQVKADALSREDTSATATRTLPLDASRAVLNDATRGSWISYFGSRSARPTAKIESQQPEVMEVDFDEADSEPQTVSVSSHSADKGAPITSATEKSSELRRGTPGEGSSSARSSRPATPMLSSRGPNPDPAPPAERPTTPLTESKSRALDAAKKAIKKPPSVRPSLPNLVLPTYEDTFLRPPRSLVPTAGVLKRTLTAVNTWLGGPSDASRLRSTSRLKKDGTTTGDLGHALAEEAAVRLPRGWEVVGQKNKADRRGCDPKFRRIVAIGIHGWFAQSWASKWMGEPTGTSMKFATETRDAVLRHFKSVDGMELNPEAITMIPLSADGTVSARVDRSFAALLSHKEWVQHLKEADAVIFACHSQGCIVGTTLLARLIEQKLLDPRRTRTAVLAMCGVHAGPFEHLRTTVVSSYLNYFETAAAKELFEFQTSASLVSKAYEHALKVVLDSGTKVLLVASTDDQVVPLHSALFASATHPSILRALYIHGNTFPRLDFLTNMLTFCVGVRNAGLSDHDLLALLSASVAGSLYGGQGHSLCYDEHKTYDLVVQYLFQTTHPLSEPTTRSDERSPPALKLASFETRKLNNPHLLPWSLRGILEDRAVRAVFGREINKLLTDFDSWRPSTKTLKDVQYRLEPMRSVPRAPEDDTDGPAVPSATPTGPTPSSSKL
ncbi:unnamed protein product [Parajaminaea phylloscopi]